MARQQGHRRVGLVLREVRSYAVSNGRRSGMAMRGRNSKRYGQRRVAVLTILKRGSRRSLKGPTVYYWCYALGERVSA